MVDAAKGIDLEIEQDLRSRVARAASIADALRTRVPTEEALASLISIADGCHGLSTSSESNLYIIMRHFLVAGGRDDAIFDRMKLLLSSKRVSELLSNADVPEYIRRRLAVCHESSKGFLAVSRLASAGALLAMQRTAGFPVLPSAASSARAQFAEEVRAVAAVVRSLEDIERELRSAGKMAEDLWSCCAERGGLRKLVGTILIRQLNDTKAGERWLRHALEDFQLGIAAARECGEWNLILRSADESLVIASFLKDEEVQERLRATISEAQRALGQSPPLQSMQQAVSPDPLLTIETHAETRPTHPMSEAEVQAYVDMVLKASGFPEDRSRSIEDDVRKLGRIDQVQREFCKHLQPLQNLEHLRSPATAYFLRTKYTCSCSLLGHSTAIEYDDIDVVIDAMKRVYCDDCPRREPRGR